VTAAVETGSDGLPLSALPTPTLQISHGRNSQKGKQMTKLLKYAVVAIALAFCGGTLASADPGFPGPGGPGPGYHGTAPEIDPSLAFTALSLIGGTLFVQRSRRRK
jgi:hypothetical protein